MDKIFEDILVWQTSYTWLVFELLIILFLYIWYAFFPKKWPFLLFELAFEKWYEFFEEILWEKEHKWIKMYITVMFFIIIISNLMWLVIEFFNPIIWREKVEAFIQIPTWDVNFNIAMAMIWVIIVIIEQFKVLGFFKTLHEYFPIKWKNLIPYELWKFPIVIDYLIFSFVKFFDIVISMFLWILDIVWHLAKIVSLSFRLYWNMMSWWILLAMLIGWLVVLTDNIVWFSFPILGPIILYLQWLLVAVIQALVFPLLIAIFIKVAKMEQ